MATSLVMRAILISKFGGPEVLKMVEKVAIPTPAEKQVLIKVHCAGVNPVETYIRSGNYAALPELPFTPGGDLAGVVEQVGQEVKKFKPGDRVFTVRTVSGSYAEFALAEETRTYPLHSSLSFQQGATVGTPYFTAYKALVIRGEMRAGDTVLVHGASGAVGLAACQIARALGGHVIGTAGTEGGESLAVKCGAHKSYNHRQEGYMKTITSDYPGGVDVLVEMLADVNLQQDTSVMAYRGRIVVVGSRGSLDFTPRSTMAKELDIRGMILFASPESEMQRIGEAVVGGCETGWIKPEVGQEFALKDAAHAHIEVIDHPSGTHGRIVLNV